MSVISRLHKKGETPQRQRGFTLFEVLIALLILSVGLLGVAGIQLFGVRFQQNAYFRSQASVIAYDMIDRIRANSDAAGDYVMATPQSANSASPGCTGSACTPSQLATADITGWRNALMQLPGATGQVTQAGNVYTVRVDWTERDEDGTAAQSVSVNFRLN
ncbi:MAG: type IV pilus modification protein PilV [Pseudomonadota bacterium]|nr:type IV pilus modification protein PilV [Pseudomonadota bacterium]